LNQIIHNQSTLSISRSPAERKNKAYSRQLAKIIQRIAQMSNVGPQLPPHLAAKRKRQQQEAEKAAQTEILSTASANVESVSETIESDDGDATEKRRRTIGPSLPPAPIDEMPSYPPEVEDESSSDDDIGPSLPSAFNVSTFFWRLHYT